VRRRRVSATATAIAAALALLAGAGSRALGACGPFTDIADAAFCPFVLEIFTIGITTGVTPTTYDPAAPLSRVQMAAFLSRTVDGALRRHSRRAALNMFWTAQNATVLGMTTVGQSPILSAWDGLDVWVAGEGNGTVTRVRAANGDIVATWTGATEANAVIPALGRVVVTGAPNPGAGRLYAIDPANPAGAATTVASDLPNGPWAIAFDGTLFWTANVSGSVSLVIPGSVPWSSTTVTTGFLQPVGVLYDGANVWVSDQGGGGKLLKLSSGGGILQTVTVGAGPRHAVFDGANIWVPTSTSNSVTIVRASSGAVLGSLTGNGLNLPVQAAFDGERVLVTNYDGDSVSLWKAADLTPIGNVQTGNLTRPWGVSSDGVNFFISLHGSDRLARF
jgi:hypothetical protein